MRILKVIVVSCCFPLAFAAKEPSTRADFAAVGVGAIRVSPFGLIKSEGKDQNMVLLKVVTDAKDKITGTPVPFNPMLLMQRGQGGRQQH